MPNKLVRAATRGACVVACLTLFSGPTPAETPAEAGKEVEPAPRPMTPRDLWSIQRPSGVAISPDGSKIAYQLTVWDIESGRANTDLWWISSEGGAPRRLTWQTGRDASPAWAPGGDAIYFLSAREGEPAQVYRLPLAGGEATAVTDLPGGVTGFALGGDERSLLVSGVSFRDCEDVECLSRRLREEEARIESGRLFDGLLYRHWDSWRADRRSHVFLVDLTREAAGPKDLTPGDVDSPPVSLGSSHDFVMSPSGRHVALVANRSPLVAASTDNDIELIDVRTGKRSVVSNLDGSDAAPRFSPDGETLAWASMSRPGYESDKRVLRLASVDGDAGALISVDEPDLSVADFKFLPDGRSVVFTAQHQGRMGLWKLPLEGGSSAPAQLVGGGRVSSFAVAPDGRFLAFVMESAVSAPEIFRIDLGPRIAGTPLRLSAHNDELWGDLALGAVGELRFEGAGGDEVHAWVVEPPAPARPSGGAAPVLWLVHGGPQGAWLDDQHPRWNMQQFAALGYLVVAVNFHGSTGYGQPFTDSINRDWGGKPFEDLMLGIDAAAEAYPAADFDRVCALGGSYGGYMVNWMLGHASDRFRCFVSHAGVYDLKSMYGATEELWFPEWDLGGPFWENAELYERLSPSTYAAQFDTPTLVIHGQLDFRVPVTQGMQLFTALQRRGVPSRFLYYPDEGHWILTPANALLWWTTIEDWLEQWLESPAPAD